MNLRELDLSNNDIEKIENLHTLKKLRVLNLSSNKITRIEGISSLKYLEVLNLSNNLIEEIPAIIVKNINLAELYLANNNIAKKNSINNLKNLNKLVILDLVCNPVTDSADYPNYVYTILKKLTYLDARQARKPFPTAPTFQGHTSEENELRTESSNNTKQGFVNTNTKNNLMRSPEPQSTLRSSYEQRLLSTQTKLNQIHLLNNQVQLMETEEQKEDDREDQGYERQLQYDDADHSLSNFDISGIHNEHDKSQEYLLPSSRDDHHRYQPEERTLPPLHTGPLALASNRYSDGPINENTLYSMSESMVDRSRLMPPSAQSTQTNWEMKALQKQIQAPESLLSSNRFNKNGIGSITLPDQEGSSSRRNHIEQLVALPDLGELAKNSKRPFEITTTPGTKLDLSEIEPASSLKGEFADQFSLEKVVNFKREVANPTIYSFFRDKRSKQAFKM